MRTISLRTLSIAAFVLSTMAGATALAQDRPTDVLNTLELRQLVARAEPADHARLRAHFTALAERYAVDARQHARMAEGSAAQAGRSNTGLIAHCRSLVKADTQLETTARALASFHGTRATGMPATPPANTARLESGKGASTPKEQELADFAAKAAASNDHRALADYFGALADRYAKDADDHTGMANAYRPTRLSGAVPHCDRLVKLARAAAKEARTAAEMHKQMPGKAH